MGKMGKFSNIYITLGLGSDKRLTIIAKKYQDNDDAKTLKILFIDGNNNSSYSFDETTGAYMWKTSSGLSNVEAYDDYLEYIKEEIEDLLSQAKEYAKKE